MYDDPKTATLPYSLNKLKPVDTKRGEAVYDNPKTATLPYAPNKLVLVDTKRDTE